MKNGTRAAKSKKRNSQGDPTKAAAKSAKAERKAERKVAELRALLVKAESKLARRSARAAALLSGVMPESASTVEATDKPPVPVVVESTPATTEPAPTAPPYRGERETPPSATRRKRSAGRAAKRGTVPAPSAKQAAPNHHTPRGHRAEAAASADKSADGGA
ncbi:MAG: hypothetical protein ACRDIE_08600 [Chloroflexota bacterium]